MAAAQGPVLRPDDLRMPRAESQRTYDLIDERFQGQLADGASARVVLQAPEGSRVAEPAMREVVETAVGEHVTGSEAAHMPDPFKTGAVNGGRSTAYARVTRTQRKAYDLISENRGPASHSFLNAGHGENVHDGYPGKEVKP
ncbi:hypothetical protein ACIBCM_12265 [Streptomyces sp. NPDC051018]|uniref:hypothetical protein n=1 Tax=Streptomyces sp. NPDC051018 TaxID=3365639 RepID=UPI00378793E7